jgi:lysophospholipase L1-like esterase
MMTYDDIRRRTKTYTDANRTNVDMTNSEITEIWLPAQRAASVGPQDALTFESARYFANQTLRQVIHLHRGAPALRIHVSNRFGRRQLHIDATRAAIHVGEGRIDPSTGTLVTFGGSKELNIAPGRSAASDPIPLQAADDSEIAVSTYLRNPTGSATHHQSALQTSYITYGDATAAETLDAEMTDETSSLYWISGVDIRSAESARPLIAAFGDSLTNGDGSTPGAHNRYSDQLARRLGNTVLNLGISGNRLLRDGFGRAGLARFEHDVLGIPGVTHVVSELGINDLVHAGAFNQPLPRVEDLIDGLRTLALRARAAGIVPIAATLTPYRDTIYPNVFSEAGEQVRQQFNAWIRSAEDFHALLDIDALMEDPQRAGFLNPAFDKGDHLHPNDAGYRAIAEAFDVAWLES